MSTRRKHSRVGVIAAVLLLAIAFVIATTLLDGAPGLRPTSVATLTLKPLWNALPGLLLAVALAALTRRALLAAWLAWLVEALLYGANALKVANLATPLMPNDFRMLGQMEGGGLHLLSGYLPSSPWLWAALTAAVLVTLALMKFEPASVPRSIATRAALVVAPLALLVSIALPVKAWQHVYDRARLGLKPWSATNTANNAGLISTLVLFRLEYAGHTRHADPALARRLLADHAAALAQRTATANAAVLPDIVIVQSESFVDPGILAGYDADAFIPELAKLRRIGDSGRMHIPTFGGGTIRTEFEVLTGISLRYFPGVLFPYLQFHQRKIPSLPRLLARHGYVTTAVHANRPEFWNRTAAFKALGFQHFISIGDFPADDQALNGRYVADRAMTDEILRRLKPDGPPQFVFAISIEAHGPYDYNPNIDEARRDAIPVPAGVTGEAKVELQNYIYHLEDADAELGRLVAALAQRSRPSIVMFYGDHLPALVPSFQVDGFDNGGGFFDQTVPWLLVEPGRPHAPRVIPHLAAWSVAGRILAAAGIHDDPWFALTDLVAPQLARLTRAPDAPPVAVGDAAQLDEDMKNAAWMRLNGQLAPLLSAAATPTPAASSASPATPQP